MEDVCSYNKGIILKVDPRQTRQTNRQLAGDGGGKLTREDRTTIKGLVKVG